ncbi:MAG TPA: hypothetical protein VGX49_14225 [Jatrophihabitans sp.]|jgi:hypothetical protein|nr:hypothetical protein [Jatrophihabitans sp.]
MFTDTGGDSDFEVVEYCGRLSCRKPIVQTAGRGRRREFCSETCRRGADREYKRAKAVVETFERNLRNFRYEVAAYGRKAEAEESFRTPEEEERIQREALAAVSRAQAVLEFSNGVEDRYLSELDRLIRAVEPLLVPLATRATA